MLSLVFLDLQGRSWGCPEGSPGSQHLKRVTANPWAKMLSLCAHHWEFQPAHWQANMVEHWELLKHLSSLETKIVCLETWNFSVLGSLNSHLSALFWGAVGDILEATGQEQEARDGRDSEAFGKEWDGNARNVCRLVWANLAGKKELGGGVANLFVEPISMGFQPVKPSELRFLLQASKFALSWVRTWRYVIRKS